MQNWPSKLRIQKINIKNYDSADLQSKYLKGSGQEDHEEGEGEKEGEEDTNKRRRRGRESEGQERGYSGEEKREGEKSQRPVGKFKEKGQAR